MPNENKNPNPEPSVREANKTLRVLRGEKMKYTVTIHFKDGTQVEFQTKDKPKPDYSHETRSVWINVGYDMPFCREENVAFMHIEENVA